MALYTVYRYVLIQSEIEADSPSQALEAEESLPLEGDIKSPGALAFSWALSDCMGAWVNDENDKTVLEEY
jgi:hypothetical protein